MVSAIAKVNSLKCTCDTPIFVSPVVLRDETKLEEQRKEQYTSFIPDEFFNDDKLILDSDIFPEDEEVRLPDKWVQRIERNTKLRNYYKSILIEKGLNKEEANYTLVSAHDRLAGATEWSERNENRGRVASRYAIASGIIGVAKAIFENTELTPPLLKTYLKVLEGFTLGQRGRNQYEIYSQPGDDKGVSEYQRKHYGNKVSGDLAETACIFERKVKPFVLPFLGLLDGEKQDAVSELLTLPTTLFWRSRYVGYFDQRFLTNLLTYLTYKPMAMLGDRVSINALKSIENDSDILTLGFLKQRLRTLLRLEKGDSVTGKLCSLTKGLFSNDINTVEESAAILNETFAPILGIAGFTFSAIGVPLKALTTFLMGEESNPLIKRGIDSFASWGLCTQQLLYSLRFSTMEYVQSRQLKDMLEQDKTITGTKRAELERLVTEKHNLSTTGLIGNLLNCFLPFVKLLDSANPFFKVSKALCYASANSFSQFFFSKRRQLRGKLFRVNNLELFEPKK